jgi:hypothetical protein
MEIVILSAAKDLLFAREAQTLRPPNRIFCSDTAVPYGRYDFENYPLFLGGHEAYSPGRG